MYIRFLVPCKGIRQDSLGLLIRSTGYRILCQWYLDWIPIGRGIPCSLSCIPDSAEKICWILDSTCKNFPGCRIRIPIHGANFKYIISEVMNICETHMCELRSEELNEGWSSQLCTQLLQLRKESLTTCPPLACWLSAAPVSQSSKVRIPYKPEFFSGFLFATEKVAYITTMIILHLIYSFSLISCFLGLFCLAMCISNLLFVQSTGFYLLEIISSASSIPLLLTGLVECVGVTYIYGVDRYYIIRSRS